MPETITMPSPSQFTSEPFRSRNAVGRGPARADDAEPGAAQEFRPAPGKKNERRVIDLFKLLRIKRIKDRNQLRASPL
jgi:hypothetical protein